MLSLELNHTTIQRRVAFAAHRIVSLESCFWIFHIAYVYGIFPGHIWKKFVRFRGKECIDFTIRWFFFFFSPDTFPFPKSDPKILFSVVGCIKKLPYFIQRVILDFLVSERFLMRKKIVKKKKKKTHVKRVKRPFPFRLINIFLRLANIIKRTDPTIILCNIVLGGWTKSRVICSCTTFFH